MRRARAPRVAGTRVRNLLVVRLDNLGDVLMTTPALAAIRADLPAARITLLASPSGAAPARARADARRGDRLRRAVGQAGATATRRARSASPSRSWSTRCRAARFDAAVIFTVCTQSALPAALLCRLAGIPLRLAHCRENPYGLLTDWVPERDVIGDGMRHEVARQLALVA